MLNISNKEKNIFAVSLLLVITLNFLAAIVGDAKVSFTYELHHWNVFSHSLTLTDFTGLNSCRSKSVFPMKGRIVSP